MHSRSQGAHATSTVVRTTPEVSPEQYDLVIIGSGTGAKLSARTLGKPGWCIAIIERQHIGGVCNNIACRPSKNLIYTTQLSSPDSTGSSLLSDYPALKGVSGRARFEAVPYPDA
jgi:choline dehydrogenase-like flavoprotein